MKNTLKRLIPLKTKVLLKTYFYDFFYYRRAIKEKNAIKKSFDFTSESFIKLPANLLFVVPKLTTGGTEIFLYDIIRIVNKKKYKIFIACTDQKGELFEKFQELLGKQLFDLSKNSKTYWEQQEIIKKIIKKFSINIVLLTNNEPYYFIIPFLRLNFSMVKIFNWLTCDKTYFKLHETAYKRFTRLIDRTIIINQELKKLFIDKKLVSPNTIKLINIGVDTNKFKPTKNLRIKNSFGIETNKKIVAFIGRLASDKSPLDFIKIANEILKIRSDTIFLVCGDGYFIKSMKLLSRKLSIQNSVIFLGIRNDISLILSFVDIVISTSISESYSLALAEAMSMKIPIIAYNTGGNPDLISHNETGFLVPIHDTFLAAKYASKLLSEEKVRFKMGTLARKKVLEKNNIYKSVQEFEKILLI